MMKTHLSIFVSLVVLCLGNIHAQVAVSDTVAKSAQLAVQRFGLEMMKGNFSYGHERMYPRWKRRLAARYGGVDKLNKQLQVAANQKVNLKFTVSAFHASLPTSFFNVWRAKKIDDLTGLPIKDSQGREVITENWLAIVPTVTRVKIPDPDKGGMVRELEETGYTIAVSEKGSNNWYFLTGLKPTVQDLRSLFPSLPPNETELGLPASSAREIK